MSQPNDGASPNLDNGYITDSPPRAPITVHWKILKVLASLQLTVVLFALAMVLVFFGTLAQMNDGIQTVVDKYFRSGFVWIPFQLIAQFCIVFFGIDRGTVWHGSFPFFGGWFLSAVMLINLLAAHITRFKISWKRSGIIMIHSGIIALMIGELVTGLYAVEGNMTIVTGQSANYVENLRHVELAVIDASDPSVNQATLVNDERLRKGGAIKHDALPFDIEVRKYMVNSRLREAPDKDEINLADKGYGLLRSAEDLPEVTGTDLSQKIDLPSAYLTFKRKENGAALGTYLVSLELSHDPDNPLQEVEVDGKKYQISLRLQRIYKPYTIHLLKFEHKLYPGTEKPKDFASTVRLLDPETGEDREIRIWMNHPLRYRGEAFYQQSFLMGDGGTVLQVVQNPGWLIPYISCTLISLGMMIHFGIMLNRYMKKRRANP